MEENNIVPEIPEAEPIPPRKSFLSLKWVLILIPIISALIFGILYFIKISIDNLNSQRIQFERNQNNNSQGNATQINNFEDVQMNIFLKVPSNAETQIKDLENDGRKITVTYTGKKQIKNISNETDLEDGYLFAITLYNNPESINTLDLSSRKRESYKFVCSQDYSFTNIIETTIDTAAGYTFNINNCPQYTRHTFISFNERLYEIVTSYRGDIGYRENYQQELNAIYNSLSFLNKSNNDHPAGIKYINEDGKFSLQHPLLDPKCCDINLNIFEGALKLVVLGNKESYEKSNGKDFTGISIYENPKPDIDFDSYVTHHKNLLVTDYKIITGTNPTVSEEEIEIDGVEGILLKGYAWWGDVIFIKHPATKRILIISKLETKDNTFNTEFREILKTFKFE